MSCCHAKSTDYIWQTILNLKYNIKRVHVFNLINTRKNIQTYIGKLLGNYSAKFTVTWRENLRTIVKTKIFSLYLLVTRLSRKYMIICTYNKNIVPGHNERGNALH